MKKTPIICVVSAYSGMGKTTFMEKLILELLKRGMRIGAIKSDAHDFQFDVPGKDSWRFARAGAEATAVVSQNQYALLQKTFGKKSIDEIGAKFESTDLILAEGFKHEDKPRLEIVRKERGANIISRPELLIAVISDIPDLKCPVPVLGLDDISAAAELITGGLDLIDRD